MKRCIFILLVFIPILVNSQSKTNCKFPTLTELALDSYKNRAIKHGINMDSLLTSVHQKYGYPLIYKGLYIRDTLTEKNPSAIGLMRLVVARNSILGWHYEGRMYIKSDVIRDLYVVERIIAHELGHFFGLEHECMPFIQSNEYVLKCNNVMGPTQNVYPFTREYPYIYFGEQTESIWEYYFIKLKQELKL